MTLQRARLAYVLAVIVLIVAYYVWPFARPVATGAVAATGMAAIGFGVSRQRPQRWGAWVFVAAAVLLLGVGDVLFATLADDHPGPVRYPGPTDLFYVAAYPPLAVALMWLGRPPLPSRDWPMLLDTMGLSLAGSLIVWVVLGRPTVLDLDLSGGAKLLAIADWVGYVAVLAAAGRVVLVWRTNLSLRLLAAGVLAYLLADFFYGEQVISGTWSTGSLIDLGFLGFTLLAGSAALTGSMRQVASASYARHQLGPVRLGMLALALLVGPTILLVQATEGPVTTGVAIAAVSGAVGVLMLVRLSLTARAYRSRADREQALRVASRALVQATTQGEVVGALDGAINAMTSDPGSARVYLDQQAPDHNGPGLAPQWAGSSQGRLRVGLPSTGAQQPPAEAADAAAPAGSSLVFIAPLADLVELEPILAGLADQAGLAVQRIRLSSQLRSEERERYFRTLVLTSEDVTVISRRGRIDYATPSAMTMFGRDVVGRRVDDLLLSAPPRPQPPDHPEPSEASVQRPDGKTIRARVRRRDLSHDPTVRGVVTTLRDVTAERQLQQDLAYRATHDPLTGLLNAQELSNQLQVPDSGGARRTPRAPGLAALFIDLDDFKAVNDMFGHPVGDKLLAEVASRIRSTLRDGDLAARLGGDEFAVILRDLTSVDGATAIAQRLTDTLARPARIDGAEINCQASIGLAYADRPEEPDKLVQKADAALYAAKTHDKGHWRQFRPGMRTTALAQPANRRRLQEAIDGQQLVLRYQPIVTLPTGEAVGFEALLRFPSADPPLPAEEIITSAEQAGLITTLGDWIMRQAISDLATLNPPGTAPQRYVSVNILARQLRQPDFAAGIRAHLAAGGANPSLLMLEVKESLHAQTDVGVRQALVDLRADGVRVAIDDYGTGCASLAYLRQPIIDIVKIDRSFLAGRDHRNTTLLTAIINLCRQLGLQAVAEGVGNADAEQFLISTGCPYAQGFYYAHPMPVDEAARWHRRT